MDFRLLGPFKARHNGQPVAVGTRRQERCLLAVLLLESGRVVSIERLIDLLWTNGPSASARSTIQTYVGRLRRSLAPYGLTIATRYDGYLVDAKGHSVDTQEFVELIRSASDTSDPLERVELYEEALGLWRGPLLADVADEPLRVRLEAGLVEMRLSASQRLADAQLVMGRHDDVVANLAPLVEQYPTREQLVGLLMMALYRSDRTADALRLYRRSVSLLNDELGIAPGPELRTVHDRIRRRDSRLDRPPKPIYAVRVRDQWLPWNTTGQPALEFCNTYAGWLGPKVPGGEWLGSYATLAVWADHMDLADGSTVTRLVRLGRQSPDEAVAVLDEARVLRASLYACLTNPDDTRAFSVVAGFVQAAAKVSVYERDDDGLGRWRLPPSTGLRLPVYAAAQSAAQFLSDSRRFMVSACPGDGCGWLFLNRSGRRTFCTVFCSMATCGRPEPGSERTTQPGRLAPVSPDLTPSGASPQPDESGVALVGSVAVGLRSAGSSPCRRIGRGC
jgi:DNA-binding SARP family transcriptional activator/predicted RNA-binding Zn ribbon-like protein